MHHEQVINNWKMLKSVDWFFCQNLEKIWKMQEMGFISRLYLMQGNCNPQEINTCISELIICSVHSCVQDILFKTGIWSQYIRLLDCIIAETRYDLTWILVRNNTLLGLFKVCVIGDNSITGWSYPKKGIQINHLLGDEAIYFIFKIFFGHPGGDMFGLLFIGWIIDQLENLWL